uniref:Maternal effect embryo arrest 22 n=1 Tax=Kalanchoe fedtschenkoi TaxID=63787 RepID=A0A7N0T3Q8_KALFE
MAAAVKAEPGVCADCLKWSKKYSKVEGGRNALRETVKILEKRLDKLIQDNSILNKELEDTRSQLVCEKKDRAKENDARVALEKEIAALKSELISLQQQKSMATSDTCQEVSRLRLCVSDSEREIMRLKELAEKEKSRADMASKNAEAEKTKAGEAQKAAKNEKSRAEKEKIRACTETKKAQEFKIQLDALKNEVAEVRYQLTLVTTKSEEISVSLEAEKKQADLEKAEAKKHKSRAEAYEKELVEEKINANNLSCLLEKERINTEEMLKKMNELMSSKMIDNGSERFKQLEVDQHNGLLEKKEADSANVEAKKQMNDNKKLIQEKRRADHLLVLLDDEKRKNSELQIKISEHKSSMMLLEANDVKTDKINGAEELKKQLEIEKQKTVKEKKRANLLKAEADFQTKLAQANKKKFTEEMNRANSLSCQLEEEKTRNNELQKKIDNLVRSEDLMIVNKPLCVKGDSLEELTVHAETEKKRTNKEIKCGNLKTAKLVEQRRILPLDRMNALEEKCHADRSIYVAHESRQTVETPQNQLITHAQAEEVKSVSPHRNRSVVEPEMKLLREQMKIAKMQLKHAKKVGKYEKVRNTILKKELRILKQEFCQFSHRLDFLDCSLSCKNEGGHVSGKVQGSPSSRWKEFLCLKTSQTERKCKNSLCALNKPSNHVSQHSEHALFPPFYGIKLASGTDSKLESPAGGSDEDLFNSSVINSNRASFSDRRFVDSQEKFGSSTTSSNFADGINLKRTDSRLSGEVTELIHSDKPAVVTNMVVRSLGNAISSRKRVHDKKRKRILGLLDSFHNAFSESKKLQMQMEENVSILHNELRSPLDIPTEGKDMARSNPYDRCGESYKKRKVFHKQKVRQQCLPNEKHSVEPGSLELNGETADQCMGHLAVVPANDLSNGALVCKASNVVSLNENGINPSECLDHIIDGNYMILLDLDDYDDEKHYREARDNLLSPSLPEITFQSGDVFSLDEVDLTVKDALNVGLSSSNCSLNVSVNSPSLKERDSFVQDNGKKVDSVKAKECTSHGFPIMEADESRLEAQVITEAISPCEKMLNNSLVSFFVVHSEIVDCDHLSRVFYATRKGVSHYNLSSPPGVLVNRLLNYVNHEDLASKDKVCVFFSLVLAGCQVAALKEYSYPIREYAAVLNPYLVDLYSVINNVEMKNCLEQTLNLRELLNLIEEFIMYGRIWVCLTPEGNPATAGDSNVSITLKDLKLSLETASTEQLVAASATLASLCAALGEIDFIHLLSYNLFRLQKHDYTVVLSVVHVFAQLEGRKFLTSTSNSLLISVLKSLVLFLESSYSSCLKCPFSEEAGSLDAVIFLLFERLQSLMETARNLISRTSSTLSSSSIEETFSEFTDLLSLVELISNNVSWDILSSKVVPQLLLMLESCTADIFSVAIILLLGQLGRLSTSANGPEDAVVNRLRCQLTAMLGCDGSRKELLPSQMAAVCSLMGFLNLDPNSLLSSTDPIPPVDEASSTCQIRRWFTCLSEEQQSFSIGILRDILPCK